MKHKMLFLSVKHKFHIKKTVKVLFFKYFLWIFSAFTDEEFEITLTKYRKKI